MSAKTAKELKILRAQIEERRGHLRKLLLRSEDLQAEIEKTVCSLEEVESDHKNRRRAN